MSTDTKTNNEVSASAANQATTSRAILAVTDLCKTYVINKRQNNVLRNVSFTIAPGEMVAVMGPSGSGKSTLLHTVSGMDPLTAGRVDFMGADISAASSSQMADIRLSKMGFVFQQMYMMKNLSIYDNIILPAYQSGEVRGKAARRSKNERAKELMRKMDIIEVADNDINEVSGGQLQRACICRSLINEPSIIFADEPTGSLNKQASADVMEEILNVNREGTAVLLVTHDVRVAAKCERVLFLTDGKITGEHKCGKYAGEHTLRNRERELNNWLLDRGW
jgi:putative ABC transport system ATP-binding protein